MDLFGTTAPHAVDLVCSASLLSHPLLVWTQECPLYFRYLVWPPERYLFPAELPDRELTQRTHILNTSGLRPPAQNVLKAWAMEGSGLSQNTLARPGKSARKRSHVAAGPPVREQAGCARQSSLSFGQSALQRRELVLSLWPGQRQQQPWQQLHFCLSLVSPGLAVSKIITFWNDMPSRKCKTQRKRGHQESNRHVRKHLSLLSDIV